MRVPPLRRGRNALPEKRIRLPIICSPEEVTSLIDAVPIAFYRTILMTLYGTGVRRAECATLRSPISTLPPLVVQGRQRRQGPRDRAQPPCVMNCAPIIADWSASLPFGYSLAAAGTPTITVAWNACRESGKRGKRGQVRLSFTDTYHEWPVMDAYAETGPNGLSVNVIVPGTRMLLPKSNRTKTSSWCQGLSPTILNSCLSGGICEFWARRA
jgi:hypothetical protein